MSPPTPLRTTQARSEALFAALQFHREADSDDPLTVIETAHTFHGFLTSDGIPFDGADLERMTT